MLMKWCIVPFFWQCAFFVALAVIVNFICNMESAISALLGGLAYCVPVLVTNLYTYPSINTNSAIIRGCFGTIFRLIISASMLIYIFKEMNLEAKIVISSFCLGAVVQYVTSFLFINHEK